MEVGHLRQVRDTHTRQSVWYRGAMAGGTEGGLVVHRDHSDTCIYTQDTNTHKHSDTCFYIKTHTLRQMHLHIYTQAYAFTHLFMHMFYTFKTYNTQTRVIMFRPLLTHTDICTHILDTCKHINAQTMHALCMHLHTQMNLFASRHT